MTQKIHSYAEINLNVGKNYEVEYDGKSYCFDDLENAVAFMSGMMAAWESGRYRKYIKSKPQLLLNGKRIL